MWTTPFGIALVALGVGAVGFGSTDGQQPVPQPFPRPGDTPQAPIPGPQAEPPPAPPAAAPPPVAAPDQPTEATLGLPIYPGSQFLASYDAGRDQRYYLFGTDIGFAELVSYYRNVLRERGDLVFDAPATHMFEVGRFREETMAFPPGVTVKDYTWNGSEGYLHPVPGTAPKRFRTVIQIVPAPRVVP